MILDIETEYYSIHRLGFPDNLQVLAPRGEGDALAHSARGEIPDKDPCRA